MRVQQTTSRERFVERPPSAIQIKPAIDHQSRCPDCDEAMTPGKILWQGIHICVETRCAKCESELAEDLPVGQAFHTPYRADVKRDRLFGSEEPARRWFGQPLLRSLRNPQSGEV